VAEHAPLVHTREAHTLPHAPQLLGSVDVETQLPPHDVRPMSEHPLVQMPLLHPCDMAQPLPHAPQLPGSVIVSTQAPLHIVPITPIGHPELASQPPSGWT
jgi:hypothetical protein